VVVLSGMTIQILRTDKHGLSREQERNELVESLKVSISHALT
jgi:hypothetical protein